MRLSTLFSGWTRHIGVEHRMKTAAFHAALSRGVLAAPLLYGMSAWRGKWAIETLMQVRIALGKEDFTDGDVQPLLMSGEFALRIARV